MNQKSTTGGQAFPRAAGEWDESAPQKGMTLRQYAAIKLKIPDSGTDWLDEMIMDSLCNDFAAKAMQGRLTTYSGTASPAAVQEKNVAILAYRMAHAMLTEEDL